MRIALTGATGFVGRALGTALTARGHTVISISREPKPLPFVSERISWEGLSDAQDIDAIIHLAGEPVAQRWTAEVKKRILDSRVESLFRIREAIPKFRGRPPGLLISASAIGYYGDGGEELLDESSPPGKDFLAETCVAWEAAADLLSGMVPRIVKLRFGVVLGKGGGALEKMIPPFRLGLGGRLGSGRQWVSWIHLDDLVGLILLALDSEKIKEVYNAVSPEPVRNSEFASALATSLGSQARFPVPNFALRLAMGEMSEMLLFSQKVSAKRVQEIGFIYRYPRILEALKASV